VHPLGADVVAAGPPAPVSRASLRLVASTTPAAGGARLTSAAGLGALAFLGAALLGLAFATVPASVLSGISARLVDHHQDIGLAVALTLAVSAAIFVFVVAA
jgi:hypothetical protein